MSTSMYETPKHFPMPLNDKGRGPETDPDKVVFTVCWCGIPGCQKYLNESEWYE